MSEHDIDFAQTLAKNGYIFDNEIQQQTRFYVKEFAKVDLFLIAMLQSLTWTGHAIDKANYFKKALDFLKTGSKQALLSLSECAGRYGTEHLQSTLLNWKKLYGELDVPLNISKSRLKEIILFQNTSFKIACKEKRENKITGIGAWLFCAPFKILLNYRRDLWNQDHIDDVWMPLGLEVIRGVKKIIRKQYSYSDFVDMGILSEEEGDIIEGLGTVHIVQAMCKEIAKDANSIVLHINSGLWKLGASDLS
jgi:hypothetical protein